MLDVAHRHHGEQHEIAGEAEPENTLAEGLGAEDGRRYSRHDDTHVANEVRGEDLGELEAADIVQGEPRHQHEVTRHGRAPQPEGRHDSRGSKVASQLHQRHEERGGNACENGVLHVLAKHGGEHDQLGDEHSHQEEGQRPTSNVGDLGIGLKQVAQSGQAQGHARCGDGYFLDNVAHRAPFVGAFGAGNVSTTNRRR